MNNLPPVMGQNDETEQKPEAYSRDNEQIDGGNAISMVPQKGEPAL